MSTISLFTDFSLNGPYVGEMKLVLQQQALDVAVVDLMHDAPRFNPRASAYLLAALQQTLPQGSVCLAVVDPGVGSPERRPCIVQADGRWFVGPDNGLFSRIISHANEVQCWEILWRPRSLSSSFHGRDLFAPVAAMLAQGAVPEVKKLTTNNMHGADWPDDLAEVIYFDHYGNAMTGYRASQIGTSMVIQIKDSYLSHARTFSAVSEGQLFWYENSNGLVELAVNCGSARDKLDLHVGDSFEISDGVMV